MALCLALAWLLDRFDGDTTLALAAIAVLARIPGRQERSHRVGMGVVELDAVEPFVADSGEGRWTALEGFEQGIPTPVMSLALMTRFASQGQQDYSSRLLAMMRNQFGGHPIRSAGESDH